MKYISPDHINDRDQFRMHSLYYAITNHSHTMVKYLLLREASTLITDSSGRKPLAYAMELYEDNKDDQLEEIIERLKVYK